MMSPKLQRFANAAREYSEFKIQFRRFCAACNKALNSNEQLPGVAFEAKADEPNANLRYLDQNFVVRFRVIGTDARLIALLEICLPTARQEEVSLWHTFFDSMGNVRDTPDAKSAAFSVSESAFLDKFLGEFSDKYFSHVLMSLKESRPSPQ